MRSATAVSYELDDIELAASELAGQIRSRLEFGAQSVGIIYGQPGVEGLSGALHRLLGIDIVGGTTAAGVSMSGDGFHELAIVLHVLTADDCTFTVALSEPITSTDCIRGFYEAALAGSGRNDAPKIVMCSLCNIANISTDDLHAALCEAAGRTPVFGFVAGDDFDYSSQQVYHNDTVGDDRMGILLIFGEIKPVFAVKNLVGSRTLARRLVTKTRGNAICDIDGKPAVDYISEFPFIGDAGGALWNFQFFTEMPGDNGSDGVPVSRVLNTYDKETGEIYCFANIPEGSFICMQYCEGQNVEESCRGALEDVVRQLEMFGDGRYSTVFMVSCSIRNLLLAERKAAEGELAKALLPSHLTMSGVYAYGEIAPTSVRDGDAVNRYHNATMCICVF